MADNEEPVKQKKARKPISPERKQQLIEQLKKARERAAEVRKERKTRNAEIKKKKVEEGVKKELAKRETAKNETKSLEPDPRDAELERLRNQVKNFTLQDIARKSKPKPKPKKEKIEPVEEHNEVLDEVDNKLPDPEPEYEEPKREATPKVPEPAPEQPQKLSKPETPPQTISMPQMSQPVQRPFQAFRRKKHRHY